MMPTIEILAATVAEDMPFFIEGTPVYVIGVSPKDSTEKRVRVFGKSRSGRYIPIWLPFDKLKEFRPENMTDLNPIYSDMQEHLRGRDAICDMARSLIIIYAFCHILGLPLPKVPEYAKVNYDREYLDRKAG